MSEDVKIVDNYIKDDSDESSSTNYIINTSSYNGSIEYLLELVKKAKIEIKDIFLSDITSQYLDYVANLQLVDLDQSTNFVVMAAILIEIKARELLPKNKEEEEEIQNTKDELIRKIEEYELYKKESEKLKQKETVDSWFRTPDSSLADEQVVLKDMTMEGILAALKKIEARAIKKKAEIKQKEIERDPFTVEEKMTFIKDVVDLNNKVTFASLFDNDVTKNEIITTFQAMLELMKIQYVRVEQAGIFEEIMVYKIPEENA